MRPQQCETLRSFARRVCISTAQVPRDGVGECLERTSAPNRRSRMAQRMRFCQVAKQFHSAQHPFVITHRIVHSLAPGRSEEAADTLLHQLALGGTNGFSQPPAARRIDSHDLRTDILAHPTDQFAHAARLQPVSTSSLDQGHGMKPLARPAHIDPHDRSLCSPYQHGCDHSATK